MEPKEDSPTSVTAAGLPVSESKGGPAQIVNEPAYQAPQQQQQAPPAPVAAEAVVEEAPTADW